MNMQTPYYLFDEAVLNDTIAHLKAGIPSHVSLCYAMKANPFIVTQAARSVERVEVCSPGEMRICQSLGIFAHQIVVSGVHKDPALMRELVGGEQAVCRYTVESTLQYDVLEECAQDAGVRIPVLIRLSSGNQFGMDKANVRELVARCKDNPWVDFRGIHYFPGTQRTSAKRTNKELERLDAFMEELAHDYGYATHELELEYGAGLPVEYFEQDALVARAKDDEQLAALGDALARMRFPGKIVVELGRAIAAPCGTYATTVMDTKCIRGQRYAIVDGGMHQLVYYGHAMSMQQPACHVLPEREGATEQERWNIYGSLCTTNDVLAKQMPLPGLQVGDVLVFERAGAYCMTEGLSLFLSRDLPRVFVRDTQGMLRQVRDRIETYTLNTPSA